MHYGSPRKQIQMCFPVLLFVTRVEIHVIQTMAAPNRQQLANGSFPKKKVMGFRELRVSCINQHRPDLAEMWLQQMSDELLCLGVLQQDSFIRRYLLSA